MSQTKPKAAQFFGVVGHGTDGYFLMTNADGTMSWSEVATVVNPTISSVDYPGTATAADPAGGESITINGTGFITGASVTIGGTAAGAVSFVSATELTVTTPAKTAGDYDIVVTNTDGGSATSINGISYNGIPAWTTAAGSLGTFASDTTISTITLQATEPDSGTITFSITNGTLPTGLSLTGANIDGTTTLENADTLYTFTVTATDNESQTTPRTFTINVTKQFIGTENFTINTYTGNGSTQSIEGKIGTAAVFNGSSSQIVVPTISNVKSYSFWINAGAVGSNYGKRLFGLDSSGYTNCITYIGNTSSKVGVVDGSGNIYYSDVVSDNAWHHVAVTTNGTDTLKIYTDGSLSSTSSTSYFTSSFTHIGSDNTNRQFNGKLDQVRIFDKVLSSSEVTTLYGESNTSTTKSTTDIFDDGSGVALYEFEKGAIDTGGVSGKFGSAAIFNGSSSVITLPSALSNGTTTTAQTISFWFNVGSQVTSSTPNNEIMSFAFSGGSTGKIALGSTTGNFSGETFSVSSDVTTQYTYSKTNIPAGWNHAVVQWNSGTNKWDIYINSVQHTTYTFGTNEQGYWALKFGNRSSLYYDGKLDQVRIYSDALTSTEVGYIYNNTTASIPTDNLQAYYKLDGDATDEQGSYDGTETNISYGYDGTPTNVNFLGMAFQPDLVWIKNRDTSSVATIQDTINGAGYYLVPSGAIALSTLQTDVFSSFDSNGFTVGTSSATNGNGNDIVAWCWKAGGTAVSNTDGSITSTVSANQDAGFSIVKYTGDGNASSDVGHGLSVRPELTIFKQLSSGGTGGGYWNTYYTANNTVGFLNETSGFSSITGGTNGSVDIANMDSTKFGFLNGSSSVNNQNGSGLDYIVYCFHSVDGYQKIGSYTGTSGDITVTTGFRPRFVMVKRTNSTGSWEIHDSTRFPTVNNENGASSRLRANDNSAEASFTNSPIFFTDTGFVLDSSVTGNSYGDYDANGSTYIYLAIA